jgi:hypothetical protein
MANGLIGLGFCGITAPMVKLRQIKTLIRGNWLPPVEREQGQAPTLIT